MDRWAGELDGVVPASGNMQLSTAIAARAYCYLQFRHGR